MSERDFSVRTKYARRSPVADHENQGTVTHRAPGVTLHSQPRLWSNPLVRFRTTLPSRADTSRMSPSRSRAFPEKTARRSPEGEGSTVYPPRNGVFSGLGTRLRPEAARRSVSLKGLKRSLRYFSNS